MPNNAKNADSQTTETYSPARKAGFFVFRYSLLMADRLSGVRLKIERAKKHIRDVEVAVREFCDSEPYTLAVKEKPEIDHVLLYLSSFRPPTSDLPIMIGDAVHNLRSALDHLAWQLVEAGGGTPTDRTAFPICIDPNAAQKYASAIGQGEIKKIRPGADKLMLAVQPYISGDNTLWHIHELDRVDKHRIILTVTAALQGYRIVIQPGFSIGWDEVRWGEPPVPLEVDYPVVNTPISTYQRTGHQNYKLSLDVAFGQSEVVAGKPVLETLDKMAKFVDGVVTSFEPFLL